MILRSRIDASRVEILGEPFDWLTPRPLARAEDGAFERTLHLPAGAYAYKLKVDGAWRLDPDNPRTRARDGKRDNVLVVGGAEEPILFAPALPFVWEEDRGGVVFVAGLRRGVDGEMTIVWSEGAEERRARMAAVREEDEHVFFRARLPISARATYAIELDGVRVAGPYEHTRTPAAERLPAWWRDAIVYAIFVDRFRGEHDEGWGADPGADVAAGGHLDGITRSLDELCDLGVTAIYLTPIHVGASCHRYDVVDPWRVDPALGGDEAFDRLVAAAHARGVRIVLDFALSHAGRGYAPLEDVIANGRPSRYASWFQWEGDSLRCYGARTDAPLFDLDAPEVRTLACDLAEHWARRGIDGLRLDAAAEVPIDLARAIRARLRAVKSDAIVVGEVVPAHAWRWRAEHAVDAATDFAFHDVATSFFARRTIRADEAARRCAAIDGDAGTMMRFVSTHDHARLATLARAENGAAALGLAFLLTSPGVPAILYGEEIGLSADVASLQPEGAWADRAPMPWDDGRDLALRAIVKRLIAVRAASPALRRGACTTLHADGDVLAYRREADGEIVDVALNAGDAEIEIDIEGDAMAPLVSIGQASVRGGTIVLGARSGIVVRRVHAPRRARQLGLRDARDRDFAAGSLAPRTGPTRIDFAVTELCNLRCRHCITGAPGKTARGEARTLSPWILDRLRDALAYAEYFGFVHGGEPLASPMLFEVLRAIRAARGGFPYMAHVLTNGVLLDDRMATKLVEHGVRSISVSLDGATAATNDAIRDGGRFDAIVANLRGVRRGELRIGISTVVMQQNAHELDAIVDLAVDLGVDWLKLEEAVPVNAFAERSLVRVGSEVARAVERGRARGLVIVDHAAPPRVWRCRVDEDSAMRAFLEADQFANRSDIHPCRTPWETACIEPNGDVRIGDFFGPVLGSVADEPIGALWKNAVARDARSRSIDERICNSRSCAAP